MSAEFDYLSAFEAKRLVARKEISPVELTKRALAKADATQKSLNCFYFLMPDAALEAARKAEDAVMRGQPLGLLHGLPFSAKDLIDGGRSTLRVGVKDDGKQHCAGRCTGR